MTRTTRTDVDRAKDDLLAAEARLKRTKARADKAAAEDAAAKADHADANRAVKAYRALVEALAPDGGPRAVATDPAGGRLP